MRNAFAKAIYELAAVDDRVVLLTADIGNRLFDRFIDAFPDRMYNCGVAEANMISVAAGMASEGLRPFCYTIAPFITYRCLEQVRVDVCYHNVPVVTVGTGAGLSYASLGATHHTYEDIAVMRALPGMAVLCPGDAEEVRACVPLAITQDRPVYMRIGKKGEPVVHTSTPSLRVGAAARIFSGVEVCVLSCGNVLPIAVEAAKALSGAGVSTEVQSCYSVKPLPVSSLQDVFESFALVVTVEEHSEVGGFGAAVAEWLVDGPARHAGKLMRIALPDAFIHETLDQDEARAHAGLTPVEIVRRVLSRLARDESSTAGITARLP